MTLTMIRHRLSATLHRHKLGQLVCIDIDKLRVVVKRAIIERGHNETPRLQGQSRHQRTIDTASLHFLEKARDDKPC